MSVKGLWAVLVLTAACFGQSLSGGAGFVGGVGANLPTPSYWTPSQVLSNNLFNNTPNCYAAGQNCAPQVGTTSNKATFPGMAETRFTGVSASTSGGTSTLSVPGNQGNTASGKANGVYNFSSTDNVQVSGLSAYNGNWAIGPPVSGNPGKLTFTLTGSGTPTGGVIYRSNPTSFDRFEPAPANVANYANDGVDIHDLVWPGFAGRVMFHIVPFQHCPTTGCPYSPKPSLGVNGSHTMVGYEANSTAQVAAQYNSMLRLAAPGTPLGMIFDWGGGPVSGWSSTRQSEDAVADKWSVLLAGNTANFTFTMAHDNSGFDTSAVATVCGYSSSSVMDSKGPDCVEKFLESSLQYEKTATTSTYVSVLDGVTRNGGGYFANSAYLRDVGTGQPVNMSFINGESGYFGGCSSGSPCPTYNAGSAGTCTSSSDCWTKIWNGIATFISSWGSNKPLFLFRNSFTAHSSINAGNMQWANPTSNAASEVLDNSVVISAGVGGANASKIFLPSADAHLNHAQSAFQDDTYIIGGRCGQTWIDWMGQIFNVGSGSYFGPGVKTPIGIQVTTWNDHEEGTAVEPGIPIGYTVTASIASGVVTWNLATSDATYCPLPLNTTINNTLDHIALLGVKTGGAIGGLDTQVLAVTAPSQTGTFTMSGINLDPGVYTLYVKLVPKALVQTSTSTGMSFTK